MLKFKPIYRPVRWGGGERLSKFKHISLSPDDRIGESWEISGLPGHETIAMEGEMAGMTISEILKERGAEIMGKRLFDIFGAFFPILVKFIDADDDLSIQVHPGNDTAPDGLGKNELWYIIHSEPGSYIYSGFNRPLNRELLTRAMASGQLVNVLAKHFSSSGDVYYLPSGRVHSIGAGNLLLEIQQTSGTTYRLHDYNRRDRDGKPRQLHIDKALQVIDYSQTDFGLARPQMLIDCETRVKSTPTFTVTSVQVIDRVRLDINRTDSPRIIIAIAGSGIITDNNGTQSKIRSGETVLVPASTEFADIVATSTPLRIITVFIN